VGVSSTYDTNGQLSGRAKKKSFPQGNPLLLPSVSALHLVQLTVVEPVLRYKYIQSKFLL